MFKGLSQGWPGQNGIPPYIRGPRGAGEGLRARQPGLPRLHEPRLQRPRGRSLRLARDLARQAVRGPGVRARRAEAGQGAQGRLPGQDPYPGDAAAPRDGQVQAGARAHRRPQPPARRHRPRLPAGTAMPGRLHAHRAADRDRPARMVPARAREAQEPGRHAPAMEELCQSLGQGRQAADRRDRLRPLGPHQRLSARGRGLSGHDLRGLPRARRRPALRHSGVPPAERADRRRGRQDPAARRPLRHQFRRRQDGDHRGSQGQRLLEDFRRHRRRPAALHERAGRASARRHVGQRIPDPRQPDAGAARGLRDAAAGSERQAGHRHRRRQHRDGRRAHRQTPRRARHHRLSPHAGGNAGQGRGTASRARGRDRAHGAALPARIHEREIGPRLPRRPRRDGARAARRLRPARAGRHRQDRDDAGRSRHHGARQRVEPDHQGQRARAEDHEVGNDHRRRRLAENLARRRLFGRRRDPRRRDRRAGRRRRSGGGARDRRRHSVLEGRGRRPRRVRRRATPISARRRRPSSERSTSPKASSR